jgi:hypothetical protein
MIWWANTIINFREVGDVLRVLQIQIDAIPAGLEVQLSAQAIHTVSFVHVMCFIEIIVCVDATKRYSVCNWPRVQVSQRSGVIGPLQRVARNHLKPWWKGHSA